MSTSKNNPHQQIIEHLKIMPSKMEIADSYILAKKCLAKSIECFGEIEPTDKELELMADEVIPKVFRNITYPLWIYNLFGGHMVYGGNSDAFFAEMKNKGSMIIEGLWISNENEVFESPIYEGGVLITPNFGKDFIASFPPIDSSNEQEYRMHFHHASEYLASIEQISALKASPAYKFIKKATGCLMEDYAKMTFPIFSALIENKDRIKIERWGEFKFSGELVFFQVLAGWLYCYRADLEKAKAYYESKSGGQKKAMNYATFCKKQLEHELKCLKDTQERMRTISRHYPNVANSLVDAENTIEGLHKNIERSLDWFSLFIRIKDIYFETRAVYVLIYNLLEHGVHESDAIRIIEKLTVLLRGQPIYEKQLTAKINRMIGWKKDLESKFGRDEYQQTRLESRREIFGDTGKMLMLTMDSLLNPPEEINYPDPNDFS